MLTFDFISGDPPEYFFDKNPENFASVLEMYRSGKFHIPDGGRGKLVLEKVFLLLVVM